MVFKTRHTKFAGFPAIPIPWEELFVIETHGTHPNGAVVTDLQVCSLVQLVERFVSLSVLDVVVFVLLEVRVVSPVPQSKVLHDLSGYPFPLPAYLQPTFDKACFEPGDNRGD